MKSILVAVSAILSGLYLLNFSMGGFELLPDILPILGHVDEATAMAVLVASMRYFGYDLSGFFGRRKGGELDRVRRVRGKVVDSQ